MANTYDVYKMQHGGEVSRPQPPADTLGEQLRAAVAEHRAAVAEHLRAQQRHLQLDSSDETRRALKADELAAAAQPAGSVVATPALDALDAERRAILVTLGASARRADAAAAKVYELRRLDALDADAGKRAEEARTRALESLDGLRAQVATVAAWQAAQRWAEGRGYVPDTGALDAANHIVGYLQGWTKTND